MPCENRRKPVGASVHDPIIACFPETGPSLEDHPAARQRLSLLDKPNASRRPKLTCHVSACWPAPVGSGTQQREPRCAVIKGLRMMGSRNVPDSKALAARSLPPSQTSSHSRREPEDRTSFPSTWSARWTQA